MQDFSMGRKMLYNKKIPQHSRVSRLSCMSFSTTENAVCNIIIVGLHPPIFFRGSFLQKFGYKTNVYIAEFPPTFPDKQSSPDHLALRYRNDTATTNLSR